MASTPDVLAVAAARPADMVVLVDDIIYVAVNQSLIFARSDVEAQAFLTTPTAGETRIRCTG